MTTQLFAPGGYRFIPAVFQYSGGVAAEPGYRIERVTFRKPVPLAAGFARIKSIIEGRGRPLTSFCACELRSPEPFTEAGFKAFNELYVGTLREWGLYDGHTNPVARSNVCPELHKPPEPSFHAFAFTVARRGCRAQLLRSRQRRMPRRQGQLPRPHRAARRPERGRPGREGALGARRDGAAPGGARRKLVLHDRQCRSTRCTISIRLMASEIVPRGAAHAGAHLALLPPAGGRHRLRDGLPRRRDRARRRLIFTDLADRVRLTDRPPVRTLGRQDTQGHRTSEPLQGGDT